MARVTSLAAITGIACGVAALIVAFSLANGFRDEMRDKILRGTAHITLARADGQALTDYRSVIQRVRATSGVTDAAATSYDGALLSGASGSSYAVLRGVDRESERAVAEVRRTLIEGTVEPLLNESAVNESNSEQRSEASVQSRESSERQNQSKPELARDESIFERAPSEAALPSAVIGAELAARTGLNVGDVATTIAGEGTLTPLGLAPRYRRVKIAGVFRSNLYEYDATWIYVSLPTAANFAGAESSSASVISIEVADIYAVSSVTQSLRERLGAAYKMVDWQEANRPLFAALALERRIGALIIALVILIAALNITTTLVLVVVERRGDIAILSAMGARGLSIMGIFMLEGAMVGAIGAFAGVALGLVACFVGERYKLVSLPADVYSISSVPFHTHGLDVLLAALVAFILSLLATIYPARAASRVRPAEALRDA
jgi:lipoprotein-releasing system permease protein